MKKSAAAVKAAAVNGKTGKEGRLEVIKRLINYPVTKDHWVCKTLSHDWLVDIACPLGSVYHQ